MDKKKIQTFWIGEFGHELMAWQGFLRHHSDKYDFTVTTRTGNEMLYRDFAVDIHNYDEIEQPDSHLGRVNDEKFKEHLKAIDLPVLPPNNIGFFPNETGFDVKDSFYNQKFIELPNQIPMPTYDIIVHARNRPFAHDRNWSIGRWKMLTQRLIDNGFTIASVGTEAMEIPNVTPFHKLRLEATVSLMKNSRMVIGQSSGAMHLASLAGVPHLVWGDAKNKIRYENYWNPLKTKVEYYGEEGWKPRVEKIYELCENFMKD